MRTDIDFADVRGNREAVLGLEHAVASYLRGEAPVVVLHGPPGAGKTMLARRIVTLLPEPTLMEQVWIAAEHGAYNYDRAYTATDPPSRPFRAPHHTVSAAALAGQPTFYRDRVDLVACRCKRAINGNCLFHTLPKAVVNRAGEAQLARFGVLFLDELPEFTMAALGDLGTALARMAPNTRPMLIAAANPCSCGWHGSDVVKCTCSPESLDRYRARCIKSMLALKHARHAGETIEIPVTPVPVANLRDAPPCESSADIRARIASTIGGAP